MRVHGTIKHWNDEKGFGFVIPTDGGKDVFFHRNALLNRSRTPEVGDSISFELLSIVGGKPRAEQVLIQGQVDPRKKAVIVDIICFIFAVLFFAAISWLMIRHLLPLPVIVIYAFFSFLTFFLYRFDKEAAEFNQWRTKEIHLHLLSLAGGWPGALLAQRIFHHKSKKSSFQVVFWTTVTLNTAFLLLCINPTIPFGRNFLNLFT